MSSLISGLDAPYSTELDAFGAHWCGPTRYVYGKDCLVALYKADQEGDGQTVEVYCCAMPARFYTIKALPGPDSMGEAQEGFTMTTGSSQAKLAADIAEAICEGMLGLRAADRENVPVLGTDIPT